MLTKKKIRSTMLLKLKSQKEADRDRKSLVIKRRLLGSEFFKKAKTVMFYIAFAGEVNTQDMIKEAWKLKKRVAVPVSNSKNFISPCLLSEGARLVRGIYGTWEPAIRQYVNLNELDLIVVPGLAFDKKGGRLGRGKGCYDKFLGSFTRKVPSIGLAFDFQILPSVPTTNTDVSVRRVVFA